MAVLCTLLLAAGCRDPAGTPPGEVTARALAPALRIEPIVDELHGASCPAGTAFAALPPIPLEVTPVELAEIDPADDLPGAAFAGGWQLASPAPAFGGLSGLAARGDRALLAVSDRGAFVEIELDDGVPVAARLAPMDLQAPGDKADRDAEGLAIYGSLALVSFEHDHRVLAFDLDGCGAAARGAVVAVFGDAIGGLTRTLAPNHGAEGLALATGGELFLALELNDGGLPLARLAADGTASVSARIPPRGRPVLTGIDATATTLYAVLRDYLPGVGNHIEVLALPLGPDGPEVSAVRRVLRLAPRQGTDNFEGIALAPRGDGGLRLWLVADDNFSRRQRTLLYAFDLRDGPQPAP
ncbi:esterase-like activity of phytase family protein [Pseudohaliea sp.]|uniref:esterase-like activity of phytase family protein n=1 Tax=Pseudohaliea sp. TaxID=2740289 RepID=UPI0032EA9DB0